MIGAASEAEEEATKNEIGLPSFCAAVTALSVEERTLESLCSTTTSVEGWTAEAYVRRANKLAGRSYNNGIQRIYCFGGFSW